MFENKSLSPITPIHYFGDSNTQFFRNRAVDHSEHFARPFVLLDVSVPGLLAADCVRENVLHPALLILSQRIKKPSRAESSRQSRADRLLNIKLYDPIQDVINETRSGALVLILGTMDLSQILAKIGARYDFALDDPLFEPSHFTQEPRLRVSPREPVVQLIRDALKPLGQAIQILTSSKVENIFIHSLQPPTLDDDRYFRIRNVPSSASVRYKLTILINREFERIAESSSCNYLNLWPHMVNDGVLKDEFAFDGDHLNDKAAEISVTQLLTELLRIRSKLDILKRPL